MKKFRELKEEVSTPSIGVRSLYTKMYAKHGGTASQVKGAQSKAYSEVEKKHGKEMRNSLETYHKKNMNEEKDEREYDYEGDMTKTQLKTIIRNAENIHDMLEDDDNLPEWVQSKITLAKDYVVVAANYLESEMDESSSAYDRINKRFKGLSGRSLGDAAKEHGAEAKRLQKEIDAQKAENERRKAAMKTEEAKLEEGISKVYHNFMAKRAGAKADHAYDMDDEKEFQNQVDKTEYHRVKAGGKPTRINTNPNAKMLTTRASRNEEVELDEIVVVKTNKPIGTRVADIGPGGKEYNVKTNKAYDDAEKKKPQGAFFATQRRKERLASSGRMDEEDTIQEGRPSQRHPLEGHEYHKKSNDALVHIAKDAHKAAEAMKGHNTNAENKYRDQANDSATVRHYRQKSGMPDWYKKKYGHMKEEIESLDEKNEPTNPGLWSRAKSLARSKFDVYPSAYANGWASKWYKSKGGGWRSVSEETEPFLTSSRKTKIIKDVVKNKKKNDDFHSEPIVATPVDNKQT